jgi:pyrroline-5-carboxylate reductase
MATVAGAGEMMWQGMGAPAELRENVTSPGGTTAAALGVLMDDPGMKELLGEAIAKATQRGKELGSE